MSENPIWKAIARGDQVVVDRLIAGDARLLAARHASGHGVARLAADCGQRDLGTHLIAAGAPVNAFDLAALGQRHQVQAAVDAQPLLLSELSHDGWTLLHLAAFAGSDRLVKWLLSQGAEPSRVSANAMANLPLHAALAGAADLDCVGRLAAVSDINFSAGAGVTALHLAASRNDASAVALLREFGAVAVAMEDGQTPADLADSRGFSELAKALRT